MIYNFAWCPNSRNNIQYLFFERMIIFRCICLDQFLKIIGEKYSDPAFVFSCFGILFKQCAELNCVLIYPTNSINPAMVTNKILTDRSSYLIDINKQTYIHQATLVYRMCNLLFLLNIICPTVYKHY